MQAIKATLLLTGTLAFAQPVAGADAPRITDEMLPPIAAPLALPASQGFPLQLGQSEPVRAMERPAGERVDDLRTVPPPPELDQTTKAIAEEMAKRAYLLRLHRDLAIATKELCATDYGPREVCGGLAPGAPPTPDVQSAGSVAPPVVLEVFGVGNALKALLRYQDGRTLTTAVGEKLPSGHVVSRIGPNGVTVTLNQAATTLYFSAPPVAPRASNAMPYPMRGQP